MAQEATAKTSLQELTTTVTGLQQEKDSLSETIQHLAQQKTEAATKVATVLATEVAAREKAHLDLNETREQTAKEREALKGLSSKLAAQQRDYEKLQNKTNKLSEIDAELKRREKQTGQLTSNQKKLEADLGKKEKLRKEHTERLKELERALKKG